MAEEPHKDYSKNTKLVLRWPKESYHRFATNVQLLYKTSRKSSILIRNLCLQVATHLSLAVVSFPVSAHYYI